MDIAITAVLVGVLATGFMTWIAYVTKQMVTHAGLMAKIVTTQSEHDRRLEKLEDEAAAQSQKPAHRQWYGPPSTLLP